MNECHGMKVIRENDTTYKIGDLTGRIVGWVESYPGENGKKLFVARPFCGFPIKWNCSTASSAIAYLSGISATSSEQDAQHTALIDAIRK